MFILKKREGFIGNYNLYYDYSCKTKDNGQNTSI
jgi:hypothetical protein